ncbi:unnamed protein product [Ilex paraguariensis]|uniref:Transmembrane protein n=1 Tax=Ilex paraguariensis TaxID=185542 RepID=A0ABC8SC12_9AQUA
MGVRTAFSSMDPTKTQQRENEDDDDNEVYKNRSSPHKILEIKTTDGQKKEEDTEKQKKEEDLLSDDDVIFACFTHGCLFLSLFLIVFSLFFYYLSLRPYSGDDVRVGVAFVASACYLLGAESAWLLGTLICSYVDNRFKRPKKVEPAWIFPVVLIAIYSIVYFFIIY